MKNIRDLALSKKCAFRHTEVTVPEWDNAKIIVREPSALAWVRWQEIVGSDEERGELTPIESAQLSLRANAALLIDVVLDEKWEQVFTPDDAEGVLKIFGPVHFRLVDTALGLLPKADDAKKK